MPLPNSPPPSLRPFARSMRFSLGFSATKLSSPKESSKGQARDSASETRSRRGVQRTADGK